MGKLGPLFSGREWALILGVLTVAVILAATGGTLYLMIRMGLL